MKRTHGTQGIHRILIVITLLFLAACGGGNTNSTTNTNASIAGKWNVVATVSYFNGQINTTGTITFGVQLNESGTILNAVPTPYTGGTGSGYGGGSGCVFNYTAFTGTGNLSGQNFALVMTSSGQNGGGTVNMSGSMSGGSLSGNFSDSCFGNGGTFTATRQ